MSVYYKNNVKSIGSLANQFNESNFLILFGDSAPAELKDYCYSVDVVPLDKEIKKGDTICFDENEYKVTAVGNEAQKTLEGLGHCTINFNGSEDVELPGTIYVEAKTMPQLKVGSEILIKD